PKEVAAEPVGKQANMVSETWDGERVYVTSSLLANWDKKGADGEQFLKAYRWDGTHLTPLFAVDFTAAQLGRPHIMHFGQDRFYKNQIYSAAEPRLARAEAPCRVGRRWSRCSRSPWWQHGPRPQPTRRRRSRPYGRRTSHTSTGSAPSRPSTRRRRRARTACPRSTTSPTIPSSAATAGTPPCTPCPPARSPAPRSSPPPAPPRPA